MNNYKSDFSVCPADRRWKTRSREHRLLRPDPARRGESSDKRHKRNNDVARWRGHTGSDPCSELHCPGYCGECICSGATGRPAANGLGRWLAINCTTNETARSVLVDKRKTLQALSTRQVGRTKRVFYTIYLLTAIGLTPGGGSTVHIYTQTIHVNNTIH
jgi:hypothetical protein